MKEKMHPSLDIITDELSQIIVSLEAIGSNEPISIAHSTWNAPGITRDELVQKARNLITLITVRGTEKLVGEEGLLVDYQRRLVFLRTNTVPNIWSGNAGQAISAYMLTIQGLQEALERALPVQEDIVVEIAQERANVKKATTQLRALEARIAELDPRSKSIFEMIDRIEKANAAADQLPIDLEELAAARKNIKELLAEVTIDRSTVGGLTKAADEDKLTLSASVTEAEDIVARCSAAYAASTSHGLAAAFTERSSTLSKSMWVWVVGLIIALGLGSWIGSTQLHNFSEAIKQPNANSTIAIINLVLALLSVGATVWFSWLSTKQIGQRFRLAEDYAFKASVSRAYEGYRREAANIDQEFVSRLFASALSRLDEQPLRLVETTTHGSPWHELASSSLVRQASESVPNFGAIVTQLAKDSLAAIKPANKTNLDAKAPTSTD